MTVSIRVGEPNDVWQKRPLTWRGLRQVDGTRSATVSCPNGHVASLTDHEIADDGTVMPSLVCPEEGCDWHEFVRLLGWDRGMAHVTDRKPNGAS